MLRAPAPDSKGGRQCFPSRGARAYAAGEAKAVKGSLPVVTVLGLDFGSYLTGSILTETSFSWPGVGRYVLCEGGSAVAYD